MQDKTTHHTGDGKPTFRPPSSLLPTSTYAFSPSFRTPHRHTIPSKYQTFAPHKPPTPNPLQFPPRNSSSKLSQKRIVTLMHSFSGLPTKGQPESIGGRRNAHPMSLQFARTLTVGQSLGKDVPPLGPSRTSVKDVGLIRAFAANTHQGILRYLIITKL